MTPEECIRLDSLGERILRRVKESKKQAHTSDFVPYQRVNKKIRHVIKNKKPFIRKDEVKSILLENFIQCQWRKLSSIRKLKVKKLIKESATRIQSLIRGIITRRWVSIWRKKRSYFIVKCQANLRRRIYSGKSINDRFLENHAATIIQSLVRVYIAKNTLINLRRIRASDIITRTVKNYFQRIQTDHNAMENAALRIQRSVKRQIAKKQFKLLKDVITHATITIQCNWRGYSHRQIKNEFMQLRIVEHQKDQIRL